MPALSRFCFWSLCASEPEWSQLQLSFKGLSISALWACFAPGCPAFSSDFFHLLFFWRSWEVSSQINMWVHVPLVKTKPMQDGMMPDKYILNLFWDKIYSASLKLALKLVPGFTWGIVGLPRKTFLFLVKLTCVCLEVVVPLFIPSDMLFRSFWCHLVFMCLLGSFYCLWPSQGKILPVVSFWPGLEAVLL